MTLSVEQTAFKAKLATGLWSYSQLTAAEKAMLAEMLRPDADGFDSTQKSLLGGFYLIAPSEAAIDSLNAGRVHRLAKLQDLQGRWLTLADALTDMRAGETFAPMAPSIVTWKFIELQASAFPQESV